MFLHLLSVLRTLLVGLIPLDSWLNGLPFLGTLHWPAGGLGLGVDGFLMLSCSFFMSFGLVRGSLSWKRLNLAIVDQGVQFQCRLFCLVQAFIFGAPVVSSVPL